MLIFKKHKGELENEKAYSNCYFNVIYGIELICVGGSKNHSITT